MPPLLADKFHITHESKPNHTISHTHTHTHALDLHGKYLHPMVKNAAAKEWRTFVDRQTDRTTCQLMVTAKKTQEKKSISQNV